MNFKKWSYELKGGLIGLILVLICKLSGFLINILPPSNFILNAIGSIIYLIISLTIGLPALFIHLLMGPKIASLFGYSYDIASQRYDPEAMNIIFIFITLAYVVLGIIIGKIISKRKSKQEIKN